MSTKIISIASFPNHLTAKTLASSSVLYVGSMKHFQPLHFVSHAVSILQSTLLFYIIQLHLRLSLAVQHEICIRSSSHPTPPYILTPKVSTIMFAITFVTAYSRMLKIYVKLQLGKPKDRNC
jgi:hypothetical protein